MSEISHASLKMAPAARAARAAPAASVGSDYFVREDGVEFAGRHLLVEMWDAGPLDDTVVMAAILREAAAAAGATVLHVHVHHFGPGCGVTGIAILAESHITVHTWPERGFAAIDIFMCGACDPHAAVPVLERRLSPGSIEVSAHRRGVVR